MVSSRSFFILAAAIAAVSSMAAATARAVDAVVSFARFGTAWLVDRFEVTATAFAKPECLPNPAVKRVQAMAYMLRQAKREWPTVAARWRMRPAG